MTDLCLCADDYAISPAVSRGICELLRAKRLSAVSVITTTDFWPEDSQALLEFADQVDVGLHITLTNLTPLGSMQNLAPKGKLPTLEKLVELAYLRRLPLAEIKAEIERQLQRFYLYFRRWPSHLDGHHHVHILPGIRNVILQVFYDILDDKRHYIRNCVDSPKTILQRRVSCLKALGISALSLNIKQQLLKHNIPTNNGFAGIHDFNDNIPYRKVFQRFLLNSKHNSIIMCHPGYVDTALKNQDHVLEARESEIKFFLTQDFLDMLAAGGFRLQPLINKE